MSNAICCQMKNNVFMSRYQRAHAELVFAFFLSAKAQMIVSVYANLDSCRSDVAFCFESFFCAA